MRGARWSAGLGAGVVLAALLPATSAGAAEAGGGRGGSAQYTSASTRTCVMYASARGSYGMQCAGTSRRRNFLELLGGAPPPTCWLRPVDARDDTPEEPLRVELMAATSTVPQPSNPPPSSPPPSSSPQPTTPEPSPTVEPTVAPTEPPPGPPPPPPKRPAQVYTQVCLDPPVDPVTGVPSGRVTTVTSQVPFSPDDPVGVRPPFWEELTEGQRAFADLADERAGRIVTSDVMTTPSSVPRVRQVVSFSLEDTTPPPLLERAGVQMRARVLSLSVDPGEPGRAPVTCTGTGRELTRGERERTGPDVCAFEYHRTSAGSNFAAPENYEVRTTATWRIEYSDDDGASWTTLRDITQERSTGLRVQEVQTLVVPAAP